jgi:4-amino-4-deoxy-L-arabinose transferase-like glycosyltransferase
LVIVWLSFPIIYIFRHKAWYPRFIQVFSIVIIAIAMYWLIERVMQI